MLFIIVTPDKSSNPVLYKFKHENKTGKTNKIKVLFFCNPFDSN